jgi:hypothetical protein
MSLGYVRIILAKTSMFFKVIIEELQYQLLYF